MVFVTGSTGVLGMEICRALRGAGYPVRALVRVSSDADRVRTLRSYGVELVEGDLRDPQAIRRACTGIRTVVSTATAMRPTAGETIADTDEVGHITLVQSALRADARRFICISLSSNHTLDSPLLSAKRSVENHLMQSGLGYTIIRPGALMEYWLGPLGYVDVGGRRAQLPGDGDSGVSYVSVQDIARFVVLSVKNPALHDQIIELGGPDVLTGKQIVRLFEEALGGRIVVSYLPFDLLERQFAEAVDPVRRSQAALLLGLARGDAIPMRTTLALFGQRFMSVREYIHRALNLTLFA